MVTVVVTANVISIFCYVAAGLAQTYLARINRKAERAGAALVHTITAILFLSFACYRFY